MLGGAGSPGGDDLLTVTVVRDEHGYGMKVSGDNPVYVQSVKEHGAAWRAGLRAGDRILRVDNIPVQHHSHQQVVHLIRTNPTTVLTVQQNTSRLKTPITSPVPANLEKQRQFEASKIKTMRLMLEKEQKYLRDLRNELLKVPDVRKQAELESAEQRCTTLQHEIDLIIEAQLAEMSRPLPTTPRGRIKSDKPSPVQNTGFLSGLPRSLSNLTGQSLRNLRQARQKDPPLLVRQNSDESNNKRRHIHNNTVPMVPTTCLDNVAPPPLPPRSMERSKRSPISPPPLNPMAKGNPSKYYKRLPEKPCLMHQSMPSPYKEENVFRRSSHSLDGELDGPQPNSIALQMSYPLVNAPPPPLQTDNRTGVPVLHVRSRSSPEQLDHDLSKSTFSEPNNLSTCTPSLSHSLQSESVRDTPPPGTPPPPYHTNTQPCSDPQRAIISMEEDDSPASDNSSYSGLFSNLRSVRESKARTAVLLNWLLGERRCACACLLLVLTDGYRTTDGVPVSTLRRWAYEIHSTFLTPHAVLQLNGVDENMANEIEHVLVNEYEKEELIRSVFRKARAKAKEELSIQLADFQLKRQLGLATLYAPSDDVIDKCDVDKAQEQAVVEQLLCAQLRNIAAGGLVSCTKGNTQHEQHEAHTMLLAALVAAALCLHCRPASVAAAVGGQRATFLQRDKFYKQRVKQITKQNPQPFVVRGHHLSLTALTSVAHCHYCDHVVSGLAPQAYVCNDCKLRVHRGCARHVEESCCLDGEHHNTRISRFMERIHNPNNGPDSGDKKSRKTSGAAHFLNMERSFRKAEDDQPTETNLTSTPIERRDESDESLYESADGHSDAVSASDDALPRLKTPTISKESLKLAVTDEEAEMKFRKGHRKAVSLSNPLEMVKNLGDEWIEAAKKELDKNCDKKKSRESLWSEEDRDSIHGSTNFLDQIRKNSKKEDKSQNNSRKSSTTDAPKTRKTSKGSSVSALNFLRRKKTPTLLKPVEVVTEDPKVLSTEEVLNYTKLFLEGEKRHSSTEIKPPVESDSEDEPPAPKPLSEHRRRLSRQTSRSKSKARGKSQSLKVNTLRKSHSGTLKKGKKKGVKTTPTIGRSRQTSLVEQTPIVKKKHTESMKQNSWLFSAHRGETKREGSNEESTATERDADGDAADINNKDAEKENSFRSGAGAGAGAGGAGGGGGGGGGRGVNRAESCRERDAPRRGKHRNASDPNRLTAAAHNHTDLEPGAATAPSGSSSSSSLSSRSNESNTVAAEQHASQSELSDEEEPLAAQWADSVPPHVLASLTLSARLRKRQELIHELIVSESSHVRWLRVLGRVFHRPLTTAALLPPEDLRALFPNLPAVKEKHVRLLTELRALRNEPIVAVIDVAKVLLDVLGESGYAGTVARFCRGQRLALDTLRERRRKNKELHQFLAVREQLPSCSRLQLRDLLATVWQRLTKYQLLLEGMIKTISFEEGDCEDDLTRLNQALNVAKEVLHTVDTAIRTTENEHRLRGIQNKLEIRAAGSEWDELRKLELPTRTLHHEGELAVRHDANKKTHMLALMLEDCLVLFHREGDKFVLKPIPQPSPQLPLSPLVRWDKVLFRPNAAVRNTFFLMNINGVQMHELSANSASEYATWVKHIQEAPLAKLTELKPNITPSHHATRSTDDSGINVSRNPSDASEKSDKSTTSTGEVISDECERERTSVERSSSERDRDRDSKEEERVVHSPEKEEEKEEKQKIRRPTVGRISTHGSSPPPLETHAAVTVTEPPKDVMVAEIALSTQERLRRLDEIINRSLLAKASLVSAALGVPSDHQQQVAEMAVAETLGQVDSGTFGNDFQQLVLAAYTQAEQITQAVRAALVAPSASAVVARAGRCRHCHARSPLSPADVVPDMKTSPATRVDDGSYDTLSDIEATGCEGNDGVVESSIGASLLAARLAGPASGLQSALSALLSAEFPARDVVPVLREENHALRNHLIRLENEKMEENLSLSKSAIDPFIPDQPSNGG